MITLAFSLHYQSPQISDFGVYYHCGTSFALSPTLTDWMNNCQSSYTFQSAYYWTRSLLYTVPVGLSFGDNYLALKLFNVGIHILSIIIFYILIKKLYDKQTSLLAIIILIINPEWWFTLTLATSDNLTVLCVTLFLLLSLYHYC